MNASWRVLAEMDIVENSCEGQEEVARRCGAMVDDHAGSGKVANERINDWFFLNQAKRMHRDPSFPSSHCSLTKAPKGDSGAENLSSPRSIQ